jgi:hypothetical protein
MRMRLLVPTLLISLLSVLPSVGASSAATKQSKVIYLVAKDGGSKIATIHVNSESLLYEFNGSSEAMLFTGDALFTLNNQDKTYRVQSYSDLQTAARDKAREVAPQTGPVDPNQGVVLELTAETKMISGLRVRRLKKVTGSRAESGFWVSSELSPPALRAFGETVRTILPRDYWRRVHGNPGMIEIITLFGVPLSFSEGSTVFEAQITNSDSDAWSQVPTGYKRIQ